MRAEPRGRQGRALAHGRDRRHPRGTDGGNEPRQQRDQYTDRQGDDDGALGDDRSRFRQSQAEGAEQRAQLVRKPEAEAEAEERRDDSDDERLEDDRSEVRMAAERALGAIGAPTAAPRLASVFLERRAVPTGVAYDALRSLGPYGAEVFRRGLGSPDPAIRVASCFGAAALAADTGVARAAEEVARLLAADPSTRVRTAAAKALGVIGGTTPPRVLVEAAGDPEVHVRREAVAALGLFDEPGAVGLLAGAAQDPDREVALRAAEALLALGSRPRAGEAARAVVASSRAWSVDYARAVSELAA